MRTNERQEQTHQRANAEPRLRNECVPGSVCNAAAQCVPADGGVADAASD